MRVLVTGGLGFVGNAVTHHLGAAGYQVVALSSRPNARSAAPGMQTLTADIRDRSALQRIVDQLQPEAVCHLAALTQVRGSFEDPARYFDVNVGGTVSLLDALTSTPGIPVVFVSTGAVYGPCEGRITEQQPTLPTNPYGASKLAAEQLLAYHAATGAIGLVTLRCFSVAGAAAGIGDPDTTRIIPKALAVAAGHADHLGINGDGTAIREFTHVLDVARAVELALSAAEPGKARVYNTGSGIGTTMTDVVHAVEAITGRPVQVTRNPPMPEPKILLSDSTRISDELGWASAHSGLEEIIADGWAALTWNA